MPPILYRISHFELIQLVGLAISVNGSELANYSEIQRAWRQFNSGVSKIRFRFGARDWLKFGVTYNRKSGTEYSYMPAVQVHSSSSPPPGLSTKIIPAFNYAVFIHKGPVKNLPQTITRIYSTWSSRFYRFSPEEKTHGIAYFEKYGKRFHWTSPNSEIEIYVPIEPLAQLPSDLPTEKVDKDSKTAYEKIEIAAQDLGDSVRRRSPQTEIVPRKIRRYGDMLSVKVDRESSDDPPPIETEKSHYSPS